VKLVLDRYGHPEAKRRNRRIARKFHERKGAEVISFGLPAVCPR
jgi:hypothetical protein